MRWPRFRGRVYAGSPEALEPGRALVREVSRLPRAGDDALNAPPAGQFQVKYDAFFGTIRTQYPNAHIFCTVAPSLSGAFPAGYSAYSNVKGAPQNVVNARAAADAKIHYFEFTRSLDSDLTGCEGHPNVAKHRKMADEAIVVIKQKTGW